MAVKSSVSLIGNSDIQLWQKSLSIYKEVVSLLSDSKTKRKKGKPEREEDTLVYLDKWLALTIVYMCVRFAGIKKTFQRLCCHVIHLILQLRSCVH